MCFVFIYNAKIFFMYDLLNHSKLHLLKQDISLNYFRDSYIHLSLYLITFSYTSSNKTKNKVNLFLIIINITLTNQLQTFLFIPSLNKTIFNYQHI